MVTYCIFFIRTYKVASCRQCMLIFFIFKNAIRWGYRPQPAPSFSSARVLEVPVAAYIKHHAVNWTFERQQKDSERWLLSLTKRNSIIGMQKRCPRFPPGIFINLYRISRWLTWTSLVTFRCSSANYAAGRRQALWFSCSFEKVTSWVMKSSAVHLAGVDEGCLISSPMQTFLFPGLNWWRLFAPLCKDRGV